MRPSPKPFATPMRKTPLPERGAVRRFLRALFRRAPLPQTSHKIVALHMAGADWRNRSALR